MRELFPRQNTKKTKTLQPNTNINFGEIAKHVYDECELEMYSFHRR
jgi:hypothetical protein